MTNQLPAIRLSQYALEQVDRHADRIRPLVRLASPTLTAACVERGLPREVAELCGGLLASVIDDLITASRLARNDFARTKAKERILAAAQEPAASALRIAIAASPINGRAAVAHWDAICANKWEKHETGKLAWLLGLETDSSQKYSRKVEKRA